MSDQAIAQTAGHDAPVFSVVIPHFNQPHWLEKTLASIHDQVPGRDGQPFRFEVIVVDNGSREMPDAVCAPYPSVRLLLETEKGPGPARNRGAAEARAPVVLFTDSDCIVARDWMASAERLLAAHPATGIFCGDVSILPARSEGLLSSIEAYEELYAYRPELMVRRYHFAPTCNIVVRREVFEAVGPFIPGLLISEDVEWGRRAHEKGFPILFTPELKIWTPARETFAEVARRWDRQVGQQHAEMVRKPWGRLRWLGKTLAMPVSPLAELPAIMMSTRLKRRRERGKAFYRLVQTRLYRTWRMVQLATGLIDSEWLASAWRRTPGS
ncbi:MAG: glycosyltransferase [Defluviimonas sp.]|nr:glycosyltransferase [Defluviimonas sp.]